MSLPRCSLRELSFHVFVGPTESFGSQGCLRADWHAFPNIIVTPRHEPGLCCATWGVCCWPRPRPRFHAGNLVCCSSFWSVNLDHCGKGCVIILQAAVHFPRCQRGNFYFSCPSDLGKKLWLCQRRPFPTKVRRLYLGLDGDGDEGMMRMLQHRPQKRMVVQKQRSRAGRKGKQIIYVISSARHQPPVQHQTLDPRSPLRSLGVSSQHPPNLRLVDAMKTQLAWWTLWGSTG